jgi:hypothetical protein
MPAAFFLALVGCCCWTLWVTRQGHSIHFSEMLVPTRIPVSVRRPLLLIMSWDASLDSWVSSAWTVQVDLWLLWTQTTNLADRPFWSRPFASKALHVCLDPLRSWVASWLLEAPLCWGNCVCQSFQWADLFPSRLVDGLCCGLYGPWTCLALSSANSVILASGISSWYRVLPVVKTTGQYVGRNFAPEWPMVKRGSECWSATPCICLPQSRASELL